MEVKKMKPFLVYKSNGQIWKAGHGILGLCSAWNFATNPRLAMSESDHARSYAYARAIKNRMKKLGFVHGVHYLEMNNGGFFPLNLKRAKRENHNQD
jgi:hypothetical protein